MANSMRSLHALPPKQVLALALAEKARRTKAKRLRVALTEHELFGPEGPPTKPSAAQFNEVTSLVLDRSHPLSDLYYKKARYKIYWGGRGSAKSWGFAEALVRMAAAEPLFILCCREFQNSIRDSSHKVIKATIERLGLQAWFTITETSIKSKVGAEFVFKGLFNNENGIRSTEGIDIVWVEEAHSVSAASWKALLPTVRKRGSEIWASFNMGTEDDPVYKMFVKASPAPGSTVCEAVRPRSIVHKVNYDSNPFFADTELFEEMETDKAADYQMYEHIWLGMPLALSDEIIFSGKYCVEEFDDDLWKEADRLYYGMDHGFAKDPATLIRCFILKRFDMTTKRPYEELYIDHEMFGYGVDIDDLPQRFDKIPGARDWPIKADSSQPALISHYRGRGFNVSAAEKWPGSVEDGIAHLRKFRRIVIHKRCVNMQFEARMYRYKVDKKALDDQGRPQVLPIIVDKHNHGWDAIRYSLDGYIMRSGEVGIWQRLGQDLPADAATA